MTTDLQVARARELQLPCTFSFQGWAIRYALLGDDSASSSASSSQAAPIVFVHGTPWSSAVFGPVLESIKRKDLINHPRRRILVYDLPGYGQSQLLHSSTKATAQVGSKGVSPSFLGDTSVKFQARALSALLSHVQLDGKQGRGPPPIAIAHDIAGTIVLRSHLLEGVDFSRLLLVDANTVLPWGDGFYKLVRSEPGPFLRLPGAIFEAMLRGVIRSACYTSDPLTPGRGGWEDLLAQPWVSASSSSSSSSSSSLTAEDDAQHSFIRQIAQANDEDVAEMLGPNGDGYSGVRCDVKILWGEEDQWIPRSKIEEFRDKLGKRAKETVFVPRAGHLLMLDQPEIFEEEVLRWIGV